MYNTIKSSVSRLNANLSQSAEDASIVEIVFAVCQRNHAVGVLVKLELDGAMYLHVREIGVDHLCLVNVSECILWGVHLGPYPPVPDKHIHEVHLYIYTSYM